MQKTLLILEIFVTFCNACIMLYMFKTFLLKPHTNLEARVTTCEVQIKEVKDSLNQGNDRFREQKQMNEVFVNCMLAFIDFEIAFCQHSGYEYSSDLMRAKTTLQEYLARK